MIYYNLKEQNLYIHDFNIKNVNIDRLDDIVNKYNNTYHSTIRMKYIDVQSSTYIDFYQKNTKEDSKFKVSDHVKISK